MPMKHGRMDHFGINARTAENEPSFVGKTQWLFWALFANLLDVFISRVSRPLADLVENYQ